MRAAVKLPAGQSIRSKMGIIKTANMLKPSLACPVITHNNIIFASGSQQAICVRSCYHGIASLYLTKSCHLRR